MEKLNELLRSPKIGEIIEGKVVAFGKSSLFLDLGPIGTGIIFGQEFLGARDKIKKLKTGDTAFGKIIDLENEQGYLEMSLKDATTEITWQDLEKKKREGEIINIQISGANKGGLLSEFSGLPAFLPVSQLDSQHYPRVEGGDPQKIQKELQKLIGQTLEVKIFDLKPKTNEIILSEKAKDADKIMEILKNYKLDDVVSGEITGLTNFGAFIKFGEGLEGLIHISEFDWKIIENPSEVVKIGDKVKAKIVNISGDKVSLSLKALKEDPWLKIEEKYKKGALVSGKVSKFNPFGAFVQITSEIQGLCHISEFNSQSKMQEKLAIAKKYQFEILLLDPKEHKMSLKLVEKIS